MAIQTFDEYSKMAAKTDDFANEFKPWIYALGLSAKTGEVNDLAKKVYANENGIYTEECRKEIADRIGDVLWYATRLASTMGFPIGDVAQDNIEKVAKRDKAKRRN